jgi:pimeloyl-ACP methyl ester carboxylesterase
MNHQAVELSFEEFGCGKPLIFLHGYPLNHTIWYPIMPLMEKYAQLILPDLRGHGASPAPKGVYRMDTLASDVALLMDRLEIEQAILVGHSMGGYVALSFTSCYPGRVGGLALVASHCFADEPEKKKARLETAERVERARDIQFIIENMLPNLIEDLCWQDKLRPLMAGTSPTGVAGVLRGMAERQDACQVLTDLDVPMVIIAGDKDAFVPLQRAEEMAHKIKKPWLEVIRGCGHMPMLEAAQEVSRVLIELTQRCALKEDN